MKRPFSISSPLFLKETAKEAKQTKKKIRQEGENKRRTRRTQSYLTLSQKKNRANVITGKED